MDLQNLRTAFLLIDVQEGLTHPTYWGPSRSNLLFETNAKSLLTSYHKLIASTSSSPEPHHKIIHVQHSSTSPNSPLHPTSPGIAFQDFAKPVDRELVITKCVNSGFIGTNLEEVLREHVAGQPGKLYLAGLTSDRCVSTTTRMAGNLKVADGKSGEAGEVVFVEDATAAWRKGVGEGWFDAEIVHRVHTESLTEFATVGKTKSVIEEWESWVV
ncbi:related to amidases related to nicotinamidase [Rhynchosporium agropyri]|uniref:Related to amidases related to nicotinamidase n=1 Tax=Rhynchosporium agropyri TaxID=914238 RepID=A0A1E1K814_9HELO|nr:related to amidases related to nicotinamidase [Rhynchosporium agropyri]